MAVLQGRVRAGERIRVVRAGDRLDFQAAE